MVVQEVNFLIRLGRLDEARERMPARVPGEAVSYTAMFWRDQRARLALLTGDLPALREELAEVERLHQRSAEPQWIEPRADLTAELALREDRFADAAGGAAAGGAARRALRRGDAPDPDGMGGAARGGRGRGPRPGARRGLRARARRRRGAAPGARRRVARASTRRAPGPRSAAPSAAAARRCSATAPADPVAGRTPPRAFDALSLPVPAAYARFRAGEALVTRGDRAAAAVPLRAAARRGGEGAALIARRRGGARAPRPDRARRAGRGGAARAGRLAAARLGLTPRELEVLLLVAEGRTNRSIGETLFMSEKTASVHVSRILAKLGVGGRVEAAAVAHRLGLTAEAAS